MNISTGGGTELKIAEGDDQATHLKELHLDFHMDYEFLYWGCDHFFLPLSDYLASCLEMATEQHPSVAIIFTLDISSLSWVGLACIQNFVHSILECLVVVYSIFDFSLSDSVFHVLTYVLWSSFRTLEFTGNNIDQWTRLWPSSSES